MDCSDRQGENEYIDEYLAGSCRHPEDIVIETIAWIRKDKAVDPAPLERNTVCQCSNCAANPETEDEYARDNQLATKRSAYCKESVVHAQDGKLGSSNNGEVENGGDENELKV